MTNMNDYTIVDKNKISNFANFLNDLADWLEDNVEYDDDDEFDRKLNDIRYRAQELFDELDK